MSSYEDTCSGSIRSAWASRKASTATWILRVRWTQRQTARKCYSKDWAPTEPRLTRSARYSCSKRIFCGSSCSFVADGCVIVQWRFFFYSGPIVPFLRNQILHILDARREKSNLVGVGSLTDIAPFPAPCESLCSLNVLHTHTVEFNYRSRSDDWITGASFRARQCNFLSNDFNRFFFSVVNSATA